MSVRRAAPRPEGHHPDERPRLRRGAANPLRFLCQGGRVIRCARPPAFLAVVVVLAVVTVSFAGCGDEDDPGSIGTTTEPLGAAEPAESPVPEVEPAGTVVDLAPQPEGMVYDAETDTLAVAVRNATQLVLIRGETGEEIRRVALPGHARHLQLAGPGGPVLVPAEDSNTLVTVSLPDGETTQTAVGEYPHDATATDSGRILVADERGGTLSVVEDGEVIDTFDDRQQPGGAVAVGDQVGVVDVGDFTVSLYDLDADEAVAELPAGEGPTHLVATTDGRLVVNDTRGDAVLVFATDPLRQVSRLALDGAPYGIAYDPRADVVWVTLTARNELVGLDVSGAEPVEIARIPTIQQANTVAVDPGTGRLWTTSRETGELQTIDR